MTGKVKEMFEKWYCSMMYPLTFLDGGLVRFEKFYDLPIVHRQGVYLQFFREQGIEIDHQYNEENNQSKFYQVRVLWRTDYWTDKLNLFEDADYNTAFTQAIEKACNILEGK